MCGGANNGGESNYNCPNIVCGLSFGGMGQRMLIIGRHAAATITNDDNDVDNDRCPGGGASCPPPLWSVSSHQTSIIVVNVPNLS